MLPRLPRAGTSPPAPPAAATRWKELTVMVHDLTPDADAPTPDDLAAIECEWPLIEAEIALVDAEIRVLTVHGGPSALDWRRLRRAEARVLREATALLAHPPTPGAPEAA